MMDIKTNFLVTCTLNYHINLQTCFDAQVIPGQDSRAVEALCWVDQRLFSGGLNGEITEYDLENLKPRYTVAAYGGPIWTISSNNQGTMLAVSKDLVDHIFTVCLHRGSCFEVLSLMYPSALMGD